MRLAFLADIHGNLPALEAVLADFALQSPDLVFLVGDQVNRCPWNNEVMDLIAERGWPAIQGNHDLVVGSINTPSNWPPFTDQSQFPSLWWTQATLKPHHLVTLRALPAEMLLAFDGAPAIRMLHGVPGNPFIGLLPYTVEDVIVERIRNIDEDFLVVGHTHRPMDRTVRRWRILNGGSVGLPYNGDTRAQYLILDRTSDGWQPTFRQIEYDHSPIPAAFRASGLLAAAGVKGELHLRTAMTGQPWSSDFGYWFKHQSPLLQQDVERAVTLYLDAHGPGRWSFSDE